MTSIEKIETIHPDLIAQLLATGECPDIPEQQRLFIQQLQWAMETYEHERNIMRAARKLRLRIQAEQRVKVELRTCQARIYEALNFFAVDENVPIKVWEAQYANQFESLAKLCAAAGDYKTQAKCYERALECRRRSAAMEENNRDLGVTILYTPDITPEQMGYEKESLKRIAARHNDGFYARLIADLPIDTVEKKRLLREADIPDEG